jgi:hypothetical protein
MAQEHKYADFMIELRGLNLEADNFEVAVVPSRELGDPPPVSVRSDVLYLAGRRPLHR